jgi:hypothetical protein
MSRGRLKLVSRGERLVMADRHLLLPEELALVLSESEARAEVDWLSPACIQQIVRAYASRFPNTREPEKTERVMTYVRDRVAAGALSIAKGP